MSIIIIITIKESFQNKNIMTGDLLNMMNEKNYLKKEKRIQYMK